MSASDAAPLPRLGEVFFDIRGSSRSMRLSWYADTGVAVFSIWQGGMCTGTFRLPIGDLPRMIETLRNGPGGLPGDDGHSAEQWDVPEPEPEPERFDTRQTRLPAGYQDPQEPPGYRQDLPDQDYYQHGVPAGGYPSAAPETGYLADQRPAYQDGPASRYPEGTAYPQDAPYPADATYPEGTGYPQDAASHRDTGYPQDAAYQDDVSYPDSAGPAWRRGRPDADPRFDAAGSAGYLDDAPGMYAGERGRPGRPAADSYPGAASRLDFPSVPSGRGTRYAPGEMPDDPGMQAPDGTLPAGEHYPPVPRDESFPYGQPPGNLAAPRQHGDAR